MGPFSQQVVPERNFIHSRETFQTEVQVHFIFPFFFFPTDKKKTNYIIKIKRKKAKSEAPTVVPSKFNKLSCD